MIELYLLLLTHISILIMNYRIGNIEMVKFFLEERKFDINMKKGGTGITALHCACE